MAQFNITITEELLHGLFLSNDRDEAFSKLDEVLSGVVMSGQQLNMPCTYYQQLSRHKRLWLLPD